LFILDNTNADVLCSCSSSPLSNINGLF